MQRPSTVSPKNKSYLFSHKTIHPVTLRGGVLFFIPVISYIIKMCYAQTSVINPLSPWRGVGGESLERHPKHKPYAMFMGSRKVIIVEAADILHMDDFEDVVEAED